MNHKLIGSRTSPVNQLVLGCHLSWRGPHSLSPLGVVHLLPLTCQELGRRMRNLLTLGNKSVISEDSNPVAAQNPRK